MATGIKKQEYSFKGVDIQNANDAPFGISSIGYTKPNAPFSDKQGTILTISNEGGEWKQQIAVPWYGASEIATRYRNNQANWSNWQTIKLGDSGWVENEGVAGDSKTFTGSIFYRKVGNIVFVRAYGLRVKTEIAAKSYVELMQLPSGYRPPESTGTSAMTNTSDNIDRVFPALISSNGNIYIYTNADGPLSTSRNINFNFVFTAD